MIHGDPDPKLAEYLKKHDVPCPGCGYNLRGLASGQCPECGFGFDVESLRRLGRLPSVWADRCGYVGGRWFLAGTNVLFFLALLWVCLGTLPRSFERYLIRATPWIPVLALVLLRRAALMRDGAEVRFWTERRLVIGAICLTMLAGIILVFRVT